jgi:cyclophilin family peptidyl-prolyl cis-trans isomerase
VKYKHNYHKCPIFGVTRLDGQHVVFGKVIQGMDTVYAVEGGAGTYSGKPRKKVRIIDSGEIPISKWEDES